MYAEGPTARKLKLTKHQGHYDLGTVVFTKDRLRRHSACVIWDDAEVHVDDVESSGLLWENTRFEGVAYVVVTPESQRTTRDTRRMRAAAAKRRLDAFCAAN